MLAFAVVTVVTSVEATNSYLRELSVVVRSTIFNYYEPTVPSYKAAHVKSFETALKLMSFVEVNVTVFLFADYPGAYRTDWN